MSVGDGHMELAPCIAYLSCSLSPSSDVRRKLVYLHRGTLTTSSRMYDRGVKNLPSRPAGGLSYRIETLVGITGVKMAKYRATWYEAVSAPFKLFWRPHLLSIMVFEVHLFLWHRSFTCGLLSKTTQKGPSVRFWYWHQRKCTATSYK
jgi:hypothetical protein